MANYKIVSHAGAGLPLNVATTTTISGRTNVNIWSDTGSNDQKWSISSLGTKQQVKTLNNTNYMLNAYTSTWNCDVYTSNTDTYINFLPVSTGVYRLQLNSDPSKYLTAAGTSSGSNVSWAALDSTSTAQKWSITEIAVQQMVGNPSYSTSTKTFGNRTITFRYIVTNHDNITIADIGNCHLNNISGNPYGINGTFFYMSQSAAASVGYNVGETYRIAINNGIRVRAHGEINRKNVSAYGDCGTLGWYKTPVNGASYFCEDITEISDLGTTNSNIKWAIGGCNLYLNEPTLTQVEFNSRMDDQFSSSVSGTYSPRTAIFYRTGGALNDIILLTAFASSGTGVVGSSSGITPWELRQFIIDTFGNYCKGVMLDGGGSTQIAYKQNTSRICVQAEQRQVKLMIKTPM